MVLFLWGALGLHPPYGSTYEMSVVDRSDMVFYHAIIHRERSTSLGLLSGIFNITC